MMEFLEPDGFKLIFGGYNSHWLQVKFYGQGPGLPTETNDNSELKFYSVYVRQYDRTQKF